MSERIITNLIEPDRVGRMMDSMSGFDGRLKSGDPTIPIDWNGNVPRFSEERVEETATWVKKVFGEYDERYLMTARGSSTLELQNTVAIGGICALRTKDLQELQRGFVWDLRRGKPVEYGDVNQVSSYLKNAVSLDQAIEAIGIYRGGDYFVISEEALWSDRVSSIIGSKLGSRRTDAQTISDAISVAEGRRIKLIQNYISYVTGREPSLSVARDYEIYDGLVAVRDEMLRKAGFRDLQELMDIPSLQAERPMIPGYSLVWGMYTGMYLTLLKKAGYIDNRKKGLILEPWMHARSETGGKSFVVEGLNKQSNTMLEGCNSDVGFTAFYDCIKQDGGRMRLQDPVVRMPNVANFKDFIKLLSSSGDIGSVNLQVNPAFIWGANLLPYGRTRELLYQMIALKNRYRKRRGEIRNMNGDKRQIAKSMKNEYRESISDLSSQVLDKLDQMLVNVFEGV